MSRLWTFRYAVVTAFVFLAPLAGDVSSAYATVTSTNTFNASGTASGSAKTRTHVDRGTYSGSGQIGIGRYRFDSTYTPGGCVESTYTGTAELVRGDGARLSGTLRGQSQCFDSKLDAPIVQANFALDLSGGTRDLVRAHFDVTCSWPNALNLAGVSGAEECSAEGNVVVTARVGYAVIDVQGHTTGFGGLPFGFPLTPPAPTPTDFAITPSRNGYWFVDGAGHVFVSGDAKSFGNAPPLSPAEAVRSIVPTPAANGYWLVTSLGRVLPFGAAKFLGDMHAVHLNQPVVDAAATPDGKGYWMVASDGGVFAFGTAHFFGSTGGIRLNQPVLGFAPTPDGRGYWLAALDGGIFSFGGAPFRGSMGGRPLNAPITGVTRYGSAYLLVAFDGGIFNFATLPFFGSLAGQGGEPIVSIAAVG